MTGGGAKPGERRGGRQKGTPNRTTAQVRERIAKTGDPVGFFLNVLAGKQKFRVVASMTKTKSGKYKVEYAEVDPSPDQQMSAARWLGDRLVPALKALELSDSGGGGLAEAFAAAAKSMASMEKKSR